MCLACLSLSATGRIINGVHTGPNICHSARCNPDTGYMGWCDDGWDHHCCFREAAPPEGQDQCTELATCHYVCCDWPQKPCGYKCCDPGTVHSPSIPSKGTWPAEEGNTSVWKINEAVVV